MKKLIENGADITKVAASNSNYAGQDFLGVLAANGHEDMLPEVMEMIKGKMQGGINAIRQENVDLQGQMGDTAQSPIAHDDVSSADLAAELAMLFAQASQLKSEVEGAKKENTSLIDKLKKFQVDSPEQPESPKKKIDVRRVQAATAGR